MVYRAEVIGKVDELCVLFSKLIFIFRAILIRIMEVQSTYKLHWRVAGKLRPAPYGAGRSQNKRGWRKFIRSFRWGAWRTAGRRSWWCRCRAGWMKIQVHKCGVFPILRKGCRRRGRRVPSCAWSFISAIALQAHFFGTRSALFAHKIGNAASVFAHFFGKHSWGGCASRWSHTLTRAGWKTFRSMQQKDI